MDVDIARIKNANNAAGYNDQAAKPVSNSSGKSENIKAFRSDKALDVDNRATEKTGSAGQAERSNKSDKDVGEEEIKQAVLDANKLLKGSMRHLKYSVHDKTKQIVVKVIDSETDEVIREIPPEKALDIMVKIWELAGLFVDEKR